MTAAVLSFGLHLAGKDDTALYDGSWLEWGEDPQTPKQAGSGRLTWQGEMTAPIARRHGW